MLVSHDQIFLTPVTDVTPSELKETVEVCIFNRWRPTVVSQLVVGDIVRFRRPSGQLNFVFMETVDGVIYDVIRDWEVVSTENGDLHLTPNDFDVAKINTPEALAKVAARSTSLDHKEDAAVEEDKIEQNEETFMEKWG